MGVLNTVLDRMSEELSFDAAVGGAVVVSVLLLGAAAGALGAGVFADAVGTKRAQVCRTSNVTRETKAVLTRWNQMPLRGECADAGGFLG